MNQEAEMKRRLAEADIKITQTAIDRIDAQIAKLQNTRAELLFEMVEAQEKLAQSS